MQNGLGIFPFLQQVELFSDLSTNEISSLLPYLQQKTVKTGDWIIREGETGRNLYLIKKGKAEIVKEEPEFNDFQVLAVLEPGDWVGEMAYLEKEPRSASIRATEEMEVLTLDLEKLENSPDKQTLYEKIVNRLTKRVSQRLRKTDDNLIIALREKLALVKSHSHVSRTIIHLFILIAFYFNVSKISYTYLNVLGNISGVLVPVVIIVVASSATWIILSAGFPLSYYGLSLKNGWKEAFEAFLYTIPVLVLIFIVEWVLIAFVPSLKGQPLFASYKDVNLNTELIIIAAYFPLVPVQELVIRGFLQTILRNFFLGPNRVILAIITSNIIFELFHTMRGIWFAVFTFILGFIWGLIYEQQKTIIGVSISHALVAAWGFFILNWQSILTILP